MNELIKKIILVVSSGFVSEIIKYLNNINNSFKGVNLNGLL